MLTVAFASTIQHQLDTSMSEYVLKYKSVIKVILYTFCLAMHLQNVTSDRQVCLNFFPYIDGKIICCDFSFSHYHAHNNFTAHQSHNNELPEAIKRLFLAHSLDVRQTPMWTNHSVLLRSWWIRLLFFGNTKDEIL